MNRGDTIAAISTPPGRGGIGVVRVSGALALEITSHIFRPPSHTPSPAPNRAQFGQVVDPETGEHVDDIIFTFYRAPHSYTGEDVVELSCHGSPVILRRVLALITGNGARIAEPGEFTFRAFLNRRLDLSQALAVKDLISAQTEYQARVAARQMGGALSKRLAPAKQKLVEIIVHLESSVEFVEDDISPEAISTLLAQLNFVIADLIEIARSFSLGKFVKEGFDLAIIGRPNVGKSSVFNRLVGTDRAIVTELPGTTRDPLYESTSISGVPVRLIDTAGIRETTDVVESIGVTRSRTAIADSDISLVVIDASEPLDGGDIDLLGQVHQEKRIIALNKTDLPAVVNPRDLEPGAGCDVISISALTGSGFDNLTEAIFRRLTGEQGGERDDVMITDARQEQAVRRAIEQLSDARNLIVRGELEEIILLRLHAALIALGEVAGETLTEDILGQIFSTFCIGK